MTDKPEDALERARALGIDISLLQSSLRLTPTERLRRGEAFLVFAMTLREQARLAREKNYRDAAQSVRNFTDDVA